jgi:hypothetical protein
MHDCATAPPHVRLKNHRILCGVTPDDMAARLASYDCRIWTPGIIEDLEAGRMHTDYGLMENLYLHILGSPRSGEVHSFIDTGRINPQQKEALQ